MASRTSSPSPDLREWLEADGLGGFSSGTVSGVRTRRYHALLLVATNPPTGRVVLVNGIEASVETPAGSFPISSQRYAPDVLHPDGFSRVESFTWDPWPRWVFRVEDGTRVSQEIVAREGRATLLWKLLEGPGEVRLRARLLLSGRDYHALHRENPGFAFDVERCAGCLVWRPYPGLPPVVAATDGAYEHEPLWYRSFLYSEERARGLDDTEDLASPGAITWDLSRGEAGLHLGTDPERPPEDLRRSERFRRAAKADRLEAAADAYLVRRGEGRTIVAGYPWFTDWGRDTFIAIRGLCLATGELEDARRILVEWSDHVSEGMLPNRFPDGDGEPEFNSVDASLWYVTAVSEYLATGHAPLGDVERLRRAVLEIVSGYARGTRFGIRADADGLLAAGTAGVQLTWMDAKVGDWVVTPRIGKPVEVQALWIAALETAARIDARWGEPLAAARSSFGERFWNPERNCLFDVVDVDHESGKVDPTFRPNQIFAVGGIGSPLLMGDRARSVVESVERELWTPLGLRSLGPREAGYVPRYRGGVLERDGSYHQGTVWPWLLGPFVEAWVRVRGSTPGTKIEARSRFLAPLLEHLSDAGLGHVSEIADAESPHTPRGCPFQAWSISEAIRLDRAILA